MAGHALKNHLSNECMTLGIGFSTFSFSTGFSSQNQFMPLRELENFAVAFLSRSSLKFVTIFNTHSGVAKEKQDIRRKRCALDMLN